MGLVFASCGLASFLLFSFEFSFFISLKKKTKTRTQRKQTKHKCRTKGAFFSAGTVVFTKIVFLIFWGA